MGESRHKVEGADTYRRMVVFLYLVMRDHLTVGQLNGVLKQVLNGKEALFSDGILLAKAESVTQQLASGKYAVKDIDVSWGVRREGAMGSDDVLAKAGADLSEWFNKHQPYSGPGPKSPLGVPENVLENLDVVVAGDDQPNKKEDGEEQ